MKNICLVFVAALASCGHHNGIDPMAVSFEHASMKPWFDLHCGSCHSTGKSNYLHWHYDAKNHATSFSDHNIEHIFEKVYTEKSMPQNKKLSDSELAAFKAWFDAGYPAK